MAVVFEKQPTKGYLQVGVDMVRRPQKAYNLTNPVISGVLTVGNVLTCSGETWYTAPSTVVRQWYRRGAKIPGATSTTYTTVAADVGSVNRITCLVSAKNAGYWHKKRTLPVTIA
jgi:hypothetical protein